MKLLTYLITILALYGFYSFFFSNKEEKIQDIELEKPRTSKKANPVDQRLKNMQNNTTIPTSNGIQPSNPIINPAVNQNVNNNVNESAVNGQAPEEPDTYSNEIMPDEAPAPQDPQPEVAEPMPDVSNDDYEKSVNQQPQINPNQYQTPTYNPENGEYTGTNEN